MTSLLSGVVSRIVSQNHDIKLQVGVDLTNRVNLLYVCMYLPYVLTYVFMYVCTCQWMAVCVYMCT